MFSGSTLSLYELPNNIVELRFDRESESVNKFDQRCLIELQTACNQLLEREAVAGLVVTSAKPTFVVGADITEFDELFAGPNNVIERKFLSINIDVFNALEDLPFPTVAAINGFALGGGLEVALACDFRVMSENAKLGFPEITLGIIPGFGGTVRLPRIIGLENAINWITTATQNNANTALSVGVVDSVVSKDALLDSALAYFSKIESEEVSWQTVRSEKKSPLNLSVQKLNFVIETAKKTIQATVSEHFPAPLAAIESIKQSALLSREKALVVESEYFSKMAKTETSKQLINVFLGDQSVMKHAKTLAEKATPIKHAAVLGAGIMGGGIAYQSAYTGTPIIMKDIHQQGIDLGFKEADKLLSGLVAKGKIDSKKKDTVINKITASLSFENFTDVDFVVEAVVENSNVKHVVLKEAETQLNDDTIIASNTSTISINYLSQPLKRPENFLGMHFFNPVHKMPLVEVIHGVKTSKTAIAKTVSYALALKKKPIVVSDCPGFLVNRVLFPYLGAFQQMVREGVDFQKIDRAMEAFGWPMGPAYLCDVIGMDTTVHAAQVLAEGFPDRMKYEFTTATEHLLTQAYLGQKNHRGFYCYEKDSHGKFQKLYKPNIKSLLSDVCEPEKEIEESTIVERLMVAFCLEAVRCYEDHIVERTVDLDMAMLYGLGFPQFRGGPIRYIETLGIAKFIAMADQFSEFGNLYRVTDKLRTMSANGATFY